MDDKQLTAQIFDIDVFPMMQNGMGYWWAVHDEHGHILKLGRATSEGEATAAANTWAKQAAKREAA